MMKTLTSLALGIFCLSLVACGGKESAESVAKKWCSLNAKVHQAKDDAEKDAAKAERKKYEDQMDSKYKDDKDMQQKIAVEVEKCEGASEGR
jgi:hypothetical protein